MPVALQLGAMQLGASPSQGGAPVFDRPVFVAVLGDSLGWGSSEAGSQAALAASAVADPKLLVKLFNGSYVPILPGTACGVNQEANSPNAGPAWGIAKRFRELLPYDELRLHVETYSGSIVSKGPAQPTLSGYIAGNVLTIPVGGTVLNNCKNCIITGAGIPAGIYATTFGPGGNTLYIYQVGNTGNPNVNVGSSGAPITITPWGIASTGVVNSQSATEGVLYQNYNGTTPRIRSRLLAAQAAAPTGRYDGVYLDIGTNNKGSTELANQFAAASGYSDFIDLLWTDLNGLSVAGQIVVPRVPGASGDHLIVRNGQIAKKNANSTKMKFLDTDALATWDGTHRYLADYIALGRAAADCMFAGAPGV